MKNHIFKLLKKYDYDSDKVYGAIKNKEFVSDEEVEKYDDYEDFLTIVSESYPKVLKHTDNPPFTLFYKGNIEDFSLNQKTTIIPSFKKGVRKLERKLIDKGEKVIIIHACGRDNIEWIKDNKKSLGVTLFLDDEKETEKRINQTVKLIKDLEHIKGKISKNLNIETPPTKRTEVKKKDISLLTN